ncbi:MAG TPA: DUF3596 domain-containing protein [Rhodanobacteraceae bacterium]
MGKVRLRPDTKRLYFDFFYRGVRCREYSALANTRENRSKMERVLARIDTEIAAGTFDYARTFPGSKRAAQFTRPTKLSMATAQAMDVAGTPAADPNVPRFADFAHVWMVEKQIEWRAGHRESMESVLKTHLLPQFGDTSLGAITRADVLQFRSVLITQRDGKQHAEGEGMPLAPATINRVIGVLGMIMAEAALRFGVSNPCLGIKRLKLQRKDICPFTLDEVRAILARVRPDYRPYLTFRFFTGVRSAEAHGLKWKHVRFDTREVLIRETYTHGRTEYTKTDGSQREIHLSQPVYDALLAMRPAAYADDPRRFDDTYVFRTRNGNPIDNSNFVDRVWKPLLRNLGLTYRRPYDGGVA